MMIKNKGMTLVELTTAAMIGILLMIGTALIVIFLVNMQGYLSRRMSSDMSWVAANEHLKKRIHGSAYVIITPQTLELHDRHTNIIGTYSNLAAGLNFDTDNMSFENVAATFASVHATGAKVTEVMVTYTAPSQMASPAVFKCGVDVPTTFARTFGGAGTDYAYSVQPTLNPAGYIIAGYTNSFGAGDYDGYLIKTDSSGVTQWKRTFGGTGNDFIYSVQQTTDGGYIMAGSFNAAQYAYLIKTDSNGDASTGHGWSRTFGTATTGNYAFSVQQTGDGGYILAGMTFAFGLDAGFYLIKTNSSGVGQWSRTFNINVQNSNDRAFSVRQALDGGYIIAGYTYPNGGSSNDYVYLIKTNAIGVTQWQRTFGGISYDEAYSVLEATGGGYVIAGWTESFGVSGIPLYLIRTDANGDAEAHGWSRTFRAGVNSRSSVQKTTDSLGNPSGYIIAGNIWTTGLNTNVYLVKTNLNGVSQWSRQFGGGSGGFDNAYSVQQAADGGYIIAGYTKSFGAGGADAYLIKTESEGRCPEASSPTDDLVATVHDSGTIVHETTTPYAHDTAAPTHDATVPVQDTGTPS